MTTPIKRPRIIGLYSSRPQCGKSTVAGILAQHGYTVHPFAWPLKKLTVSFLMQFGYTKWMASNFVYKDREASIPGIPGHPTARHLMQTLGTEWGRELVHRDVWLDMWQSSLPLGSVVVDDMRFTSESRAIKDLGGEWWRVIRPGEDHETRYGSTHPSEGALDDLKFDRVIINDGDKLDLMEKVAVALEAS
jgi:hypothetical protein